MAQFIQRSKFPFHGGVETGNEVGNPLHYMNTSLMLYSQSDVTYDQNVNYVCTCSSSHNV